MNGTDFVYQSYHSGIETIYGIKGHATNFNYQSYHSGIETNWVKLIPSISDASTNRTIVELKLTIVRPVKPITLPTNRTIVELKLKNGARMIRVNSTTNRTIVELKLDKALV